MASSGNFATINFQAQSLKSTVTPTLGNLKFDGSTLNPSNYEGVVVCNFGMKGGKWYWETYLSGGGTSGGGIDWNVGFAPYSTASKSVDDGTYGLHLGNGSSATLSGYGYTQYPSGTAGVRHNNSTSSFGSAHTSGDVLGHALDLDNGTWIIYKNGSSLGTAATGIDTSLTYFAAGGAQGGTVSNFDVTFNFGQDSTFGGALSAGGNADDNGFGDFKYAPPTGFLALCSGNLPISADIDPAQTDDDYPSKQFGVAAYSGNSGTQSINLGFKPDLIWTKIRVASDSRIVDSTRGTDDYLISNNNNTEATVTTGVTGFTSTGYNLGSDGIYNGSSYTYVSWCWRANGGTTASNSDGSITSTVQANTKAGFSIITFTSPNNSSDQTVGHGLTKAPEFIIAKNLDTTYNWDCFHIGLSDTTKGLRLNTTDVPLSGRWGTVNTTTIGTKNAYTHSGTDDYVFYAWHSVEGYQKFGTYIGNGNADGTFVYTGGRPSLIAIKRTDSSGSWHVFDSARNTFNPVNTYLLWDSSSADDTASSNAIDFLSNGFKIRNNASGLNASGGNYIFMCWNSVPFKYNNTF
jgi:hypothetical protein